MTAPTGLRVSGLVARTDDIAWEEIAALPDVVADAATVAPGAAGAAVAMAPVIALAGPEAGATHCTVASRDGVYTASIPIATLVDGGWLAFALDGRPLPADLGGPLRLTVADGTTLCWNVKDVGELRFTAAHEPDSVPEDPPH
jgi:DMSO/TMAO reductase YedYZ molybdopterin-dependent catalytic subunit